MAYRQNRKLDFLISRQTVESVDERSEVNFDFSGYPIRLQLISFFFKESI
jgi:hypothetical protein